MARDELDGWNGIILFARYHSDQAGEYLPKLVELAAESREYSVNEKQMEEKNGDAKQEAGLKSSGMLKTSLNFRAAAAEGCGFVLLGGGKASQKLF